MKPLSEQLRQVSDRVKETEDLAAVSRDKDRQKLEAQRTKVKASISSSQEQAKASFESA